MRVAVGGEHFKNAVMQLQNRDVEGAAAEVIYGDGSFLALVESIGQCRRGWLIDQPQDFKSGDSPRVTRCLSLCVVEIRGYGDHRFGDRDPECLFRILLQLAQDERGNFRRRKRLLTQLNSDD